MAITTEERQRLAQILEENRISGRAPTRVLDPITDESVALVRLQARSKAPYHAFADGEPACGASSDYGYDAHPIDEAASTHPPCSYCYPEEHEYGGDR